MGENVREEELRECRVTLLKVLDSSEKLDGFG
jgi:hypothetical protein